MKMTKKINVQGGYARKEPYNYEGVNYDADIKNGDKVKITSKGETVVGQYGEQTVFKITTRNGEKNLAFNQKSINILIDELGDESEKWVGKEVNVILKKDIVSGKKVIIAYIVLGKWELDEFGDLVKIEKIKKNDDDITEINDNDNPFDN